jgi:hypothetical protein
MAVLHFHQHHPDYPSPARRLRSQEARGRPNAPDSFSRGPGLVLTAIGLALLAGFVWASAADAAPADELFIVFGCPFLVFGGILVLIGCVEVIWRRLRRIQNHCGRCRFYQALEGQYSLGHCRADPRQAMVHRTGACTFFDYSERAMVRDRFAQRAESLARSRKQESKQRVAHR